MGKYTIIADVGKGILNMLRDKLVPEPINKAESIGLCEPKERGGYIVGIHPYDLREELSGRGSDPVPRPDGSVQDPPAMIELYYMVSVSSKAELESKALDEAKIIGKIIQVFKDNPSVPMRYMPNNMGMELENVPVTMQPLSMEEKVKVWTMFGESYKLSVFYIVGPVAIDSEIIHKPRKRVETIHLGTSEYSPEHELKFATKIKEEDIDDEYSQRPDEDELEDEEGGDDSLGLGEDGLGEDGGESLDLGEDGLGEDGDESLDLGEDGQEEDGDESLDLGEDGQEEDGDESLDLGEDDQAGDGGESLDLGEDGLEEDGDANLDLGDDISTEPSET